MVRVKMKKIVSLVIGLFCLGSLYAAQSDFIDTLSMIQTDRIQPQDTYFGPLCKQTTLPSAVKELLESFFLQKISPEEHLNLLADESAYMLQTLYSDTLFSRLPAEDMRIGKITETDGLQLPFRLFFADHTEHDSIIGTIFLLEEDDIWKIAHIEMRFSDQDS